MENKMVVIKAENQFKSKDLNTATARLAKCYQNIEKNKKDACVVMWHVEDKKAYKEDGFESLAEYAAAIGIDKSTAHKMADAGMIWDNHNPMIAEKAKDMDYTAVSTLASLDKEDKDGNKRFDLAGAIERGELDGMNSVAELKAWKADALSKEKGEKVVPNWHIMGHLLRVCRKGITDECTVNYEYIDTVIGIENPKDWAKEFWNDSIVAQVQSLDGNKMYLAICGDGSMFEYSAEKVKKGKKVKAVKSVKNMTLEELRAELARREAEEQ